MKKKLMKRLKIVTLAALLSTYPVQFVSAMSNETIVNNEDNTDDYTIDFVELSEESVSIEGYLEKNMDYNFILDEESITSFQTDLDGFYSVVLSNETLTDSIKYRIETADFITVHEGNINHEKNLLPPDIEQIISTDTTIEGYNADGTIVHVYINNEKFDEKNVSKESPFIISLKETLLPDTTVSVYVEDENENTSETVETSVIPDENTEELDQNNTENEDEKISDTTEESLVENDSNKNKEISSIASYSLNSLINEPKGKTYHFVQAGETLYSLAGAYNTTVEKLLKWNNLKDASMLKAGSLISVDGRYVYNEITNETTQFPNNQAFLNYIIPYAKDISKEYNLYTSIMIAQALHESNWGRSNLAKLGNNLFGVKGTYNGNSIVMMTWEEKPNGEVIWIQDHFRLYPTFRESIIDNAVKLRHGVSWDANYYSGAWVENTASHMDGTEWLTGRYATDSAYNTKVNNTIKNHNLLKYDEHIKITNPIISQGYLNKETYVTNTSTPIYTQPYGTASYKQVDNSSNYRGELLKVKQEKINNLGSWYLIYDNDRKLGWINEKGITELYHTVTKSTNVNYRAQISKPWSINSRPWGTAGSKSVADSNLLVGQTVTVTKEEITERGTYALINIDGKELGWIDKSGIDLQIILDSKAVNYDVKVVKPWSINTKPWGIAGSELVQNKAIIGNMYSIKEEAVTPRSTYILLTNQGKDIGWIDKNAIETLDSVLSTKSVTYAAEVTHPWSINTQPWGTKNAEFIMNAHEYVGSTVEVIQEKVTPRSTYALLKSGNKELGWIDTTGISQHTILSSKSVNYIANITKPWSINTKPWGTSGYQTVISDNSKVGKTVNVIKEEVTPRTTYLLLEENGIILGWIDATGVKKNRTVTSHREVNYSATITKPWSINTAPWGSKGYKLIANERNYLNKVVTVKAEQVTDRSTYALLEDNGKELGWIDVTGIEYYQVLSKKTVNYSVTITKPWSINTEPWGIYGYQAVISDSSKVGKVVDVIEERVTPRSTYLLLEENGKKLGWIDYTGVRTNQEILSSRSTDYAANIVKPWSVNSKPWGTAESMLIDTGSKYLGKEVKIKAEQVTERSTYGLMEFKGEEIGWIDITGIKKHTVLSTRNSSYTATVTKPWSVNTLPWGIEGFKEVSLDNNLVGKKVTVKSEKVTARSTYALIELNGRELGWIDTSGIKR